MNISLTPYPSLRRAHRDGRACLIFLTLFERVYVPLTAGLLGPVSADARLAEDKRHHLDRRDQRLVDDLDALLNAVGVKTAA